MFYPALVDIHNYHAETPAIASNVVNEDSNDGSGEEIEDMAEMNEGGAEDNNTVETSTDIDITAVIEEVSSSPPPPPTPPTPEPILETEADIAAQVKPLPLWTIPVLVGRLIEINENPIPIEQLNEMYMSAAAYCTDNVENLAASIHSKSTTVIDLVSTNGNNSNINNNSSKSSKTKSTAAASAASKASVTNNSIPDK